MRIGLLGYGVVGGGVYELAGSRGVNSNMTVERILMRREREEVRSITVRNVDEVLSDDSIDTVVEALGGSEPAHSAALRAINSGRNVVTANKLMLSENYEELVSAARRMNVSLAFSASVGGGIPYLVNLISAADADEIVSLGGIMNGTTNFILSAMEQEGASFGATLAQAQRAGYAEADPSADIDGLDAGCKLAIASSVAWSGALDPRDIPISGIRNIRASDIARFRELGFAVRLIAAAERTCDGVAASVMPRLYPFDAPEAAVSGTGNLISFEGKRFGAQSFSGLGAGREPTSYAVYKDLRDVASGVSPFDRVRCGGRLAIDSMGGRSMRAYIRSSAPLDGALALSERIAEDAYITRPASPASVCEAVKRMAAGDGEAFAALIN